jgi:hypothetical protein
MLLCMLLVKFIFPGTIWGGYEEKNPGPASASPEPVFQKDSEDDVKLENGSLPVPEKHEDVVFDYAENDENMVISPSSVWSVAADMAEFKPGFTKEPIGDELFAYISGVSFPVTLEALAPILKQRELSLSDFEEIEHMFPNIIDENEEVAISRDELSFLTLLYYDFDGNEQTGELICNVALADDFLAIFYELYLNKYPFERICLVEEFGGSDRLAMISNNTTGFNYRKSASGNLSKHALGLAIDVNPFYNPYIIYDKEGNITRLSPEGSDYYIDRDKDFLHKIDENDLCYRLFMEHGVFWGGDWKLEKDYMHFQKVP